MTYFSDFLFGSGGYSPHGFCIAWNPFILYTHIVSDLLIAASYFAIPALIMIFLRRRKDPSLHKPALLFVTFITACGLTHLAAILTMYVPAYGLQGLLKLFTGIVSFVTAIALARMMPQALKIPAPQELIQALKQKNKEILEREKAELLMAESERCLAQKVEELEATNNELKEFAYAASHDLKSPANTLGMWLEDFEDEYADQLDEEGRESLEDAAQLVGRMRSLVEDVLSFSRVVNRAPDDLVMVDMNEVFADVSSNLAEAIKSSNAKIDVGPLPPLPGYRSLLVILAQNMLSNAIKFSQTNQTPEISVRGRDTGGTIEISVRDNGIGIEMDHQERIFQLFKRLHTREEFEGSGLGLALCRRIAISHGGSIRVNSEVGEGAEFVATFPSERVDVPEAA